jgi:hypothetical protein
MISNLSTDLQEIKGKFSTFSRLIKVEKSFNNMFNNKLNSGKNKKKIVKLILFIESLSEVLVKEV